MKATEQIIFLLLIILATNACSSCRKQAEPGVRKIESVRTGPPGYPPPIMDQPYPGTGVVVLINRKEGWIEINHEDIKGLMPAMQMEFWVKDKSILDNAKAGDRVDFTIVETAKGEYLTQLKKISN